MVNYKKAKKNLNKSYNNPSDLESDRLFGKVMGFNASCRCEYCLDRGTYFLYDFKILNEAIIAYQEAKDAGCKTPAEFETFIDEENKKEINRFLKDNEENSSFETALTILSQTANPNAFLISPLPLEVPADTNNARFLIINLGFQASMADCKWMLMNNLDVLDGAKSISNQQNFDKLLRHMEGKSLKWPERSKHKQCMKSWNH